MTFVSLAFFVFLALVLLGRLSVGRRKSGPSYLALLVLASLVFYAWHEPVYLALVFYTATLNFLCGLGISRLPVGSPRRKALLAACIAFNLAPLLGFKYLGFLNGIVQDLLLAGGVEQPAWSEDLGKSLRQLALPIGISFYTFHGMSYAIDLFRDQTKRTLSYWRFFLYVIFFPQLVAGPIVRAGEFLYQLDRPRGLRAQYFLEGGWLMIRGFFLKVVVADNLAVYVDAWWGEMAKPGQPGLLCLLLAFLFSCQIFADFAGYTDIARGVAYLLGFRLPVNFNLPYRAASFSDFWRRWHMSLSRWFRDYVYLPLGGNRQGPARTYLNLALVMGLVGLWHGASFTFLAWGCLHGLALALERLLGLNRPAKDGAGRWWWYVLTQAVVLAAWVFFRSQSLGQATGFLANLANWPSGVRHWETLSPALWFTLPVVIFHLRGWARERGWLGPAGTWERGLAAGIMLYALFTWYGEEVGFIYFQF